MTNAQMYKKVFGFEPDMGNCPTHLCSNCPINDCDSGSATNITWWNSEYKGNANILIEVTERHIFAKPDDVNKIDFPNASSENK